MTRSYDLLQNYYLHAFQRPLMGIFGGYVWLQNVRGHYQCCSPLPMLDVAVVWVIVLGQIHSVRVDMLQRWRRCRRRLPATCPFSKQESHRSGACPTAQPANQANGEDKATVCLGAAAGHPFAEQAARLSCCQNSSTACIRIGKAHQRWRRRRDIRKKDIRLSNPDVLNPQGRDVKPYGAVKHTEIWESYVREKISYSNLTKMKRALSKSIWDTSA